MLVIPIFRPFDVGDSQGRAFQGGDTIELFQLWAVNEFGPGSRSTASFILLDVPGMPTSVTVLETGANTVRVTVSAPDNDGYGRKATDLPPMVLQSMMLF